MSAPTAIIVGSGIAGLTAALHAASGGALVTLVTKDRLEHANTRFAQGGIAAVSFADDRVADHLADTLRAGGGLCDPEAALVLVTEGPARVEELIELGVAFDRDATGAFAKGLEAAHSYPRVLHAGGDATGLEIERALAAAVRGAGVEVLEHAFLVDLLVEGGRVSGVDLLIGDEGFREQHRAAAVVLATGGAGQLYSHTTNPEVATGDGIAAAIRAGASVRDLEFVQFHPTIVAVGEAFLISEAVRGEGATLIDESGRRFAFDAHPDGELAPRDTVARSIARTMRAQGGTPVRLDTTAISADVDARTEFLARRFPTIDAALRERGIDWAREAVPVTPAAHYLMGGIVTDLYGRTSIPGLYAVGEVACTGVHGANRLASNSLLEGAVFGARSGAALVDDSRDARWPGSEVKASEPQKIAQVVDIPPQFSRTALQDLMWQHAGLERDAAGLEHAAAVLAMWRSQPRSAHTEFEFENENLLEVASAVVAAALARPASVGAHFRTDDPLNLALVIEEEALAC